MANKKYYVIDFDSTFIKVEALEELARIALRKNPKKEKIIDEIEELTNQGIEGEISFTDGLGKRIELMNAHRDHLDKLVRQLKKKITTSIKRNKHFFKEHLGHVYVISAGFKEFISPIVEQYNIPEEHIYANTFQFDKRGNIIGFDEQNLLSKTNGKKEQLQALKLDGEIHIIGDGYSDSQMKNGDDGAKFFAFTENIERSTTLQEADHVAPSFDEFLFHNKLPMAISYPKNRISVLLLENIHPNATELFKEEGYQIETVNRSLSEEELKERIKEVSVLGIRSKTQITSEVLKSAQRLMCVGAFCIGTNQIDLRFSLQKGVAVFNAPYSNTRSVVELVIGQIVMLMRGIPEKNRLML